MLRFQTSVSKQTGYLRTEWTTAIQVEMTVTITGYPIDKNGKMWTTNGKIAGKGTSKTNYSIDTTGGQSGSSVYRVVNK